MDLGSDASSRSSSESNSNKVTPCSPSIDLTALEDYEEDEDYQHYKKKVIEEWESEYRDNYSSSQHPGPEKGGGGGNETNDHNNIYTKTVNVCNLTDELHEMKTVPSMSPSEPAATSDSSPEELKQNGNVIVPRSKKKLHAAGQEGTDTSSQRSSGQARVNRSAEGATETKGHTGRYRQDQNVEEEPLPTMDWAALERHLAGLQCREQENQNLNHNYNYNTGKTHYTSVSVQTSMSSKLLTHNVSVIINPAVICVNQIQKHEAMLAEISED